MVYLKGSEEQVGFMRVGEEKHRALGNEPVDGVEELTQGL